MDDLWKQVGNRCLELAKTALNKETVPTEETVETVERLVRIAISIDELNLRWAKRNLFGAEVFADQSFLQQGAKN